MKFYAGIGSRSTPPEECAKLTRIAEILERRGYVLRSGGAEGADKAFEAGVKDPTNKIILRPKHSTADAEKIAASIHPAWSMCNEYARQLHGRNAQLVLGQKLDQHADFVLAWTYDGADRGGTRTGLVLAKLWNIPRFNLAKPEDAKAFLEFLNNVEAN